MPFAPTSNRQSDLQTPLVTLFDITYDVATIGVLGTIAYIAFAAGSPGWMILGAIFAFGAVGSLIDFLTSLF